MQYEQALSQISEIHDHLARSEVYRGFRSLPIALSGVLGLGAAALAARGGVADEWGTAVRYWIVVGVLGALTAGSETALNYFRREDSFARRRTRRVLAQFLPGLAVGVALAVALVRQSEPLAALLPGLWSLVFALAIFSARPYLPRATGWIGLYYLAAGSLLVAFPPVSAVWFDWAVGGVFGVGQLGSALVLFWNVERE